MRKKTILVLGAGAAGLAAANELARKNFRVKVLEARERPGGRIHTVEGASGQLVELGAEFIHGDQNVAWSIIRSARLSTRRIPDRHWRLTHAGLLEQRGYWESIQAVLARANPAAPDQDFESFVEQAWSVDEASKTAALEFVEGFHAAPANEISVHSVALAEEAGEKAGGTRQFRLSGGYSGMVSALLHQLEAAGVELELNTMVHAVRWQPGHVVADARTSAGERTFEADAAIIALPLGVLRARDVPGAVLFDPALPTPQETAIRSLGVGSALKLTLLFKSCFWPRQLAGFLHAGEAAFPTWWMERKLPMLTAWAGGRKANALFKKPRESLVGDAIQTAAALFCVDERQIRDQLVAAYSYDWLDDPFSRGPYSFTPRKMARMPRQLSLPIAETLFFAGEATNTEGNQGTVHGALATGMRAATQLLNAGRSPARKKELQYQA